ncbi:hypothetical protein [Hymenobacter sp. PAMC 26628]|uniref:hypothetical protein n=1 Tax=Hymenobacter sp. PAMC 26628 TaxID=1484118 RepID=UPI000AD2A2A9|nr:hypothetical protein [Hymenobacter sp. PAMC 26628]
MTVYNKILATLIMLIILLPNLYSIYLGRESFPYTNAPMFGHYIGASTYFYDIKFLIDSGSTTKRIFPYYDGEKQSIDYIGQRFFFNNIYGSAEKKSPFGYSEPNTSEAFELRMDAFFQAYFKHLFTGKSANLKVRCEVSQYNNEWHLLSSHTIGYYDVPLKKFKHTWKRNP